MEVASKSLVSKEFAGEECWRIKAQHRNRGGKYQGGSDTGRMLNTAIFSLFSLLWVQITIGLGGRIQCLLKYDGGTLEEEVAALYWAVHAASLSHLMKLYNVM